MVANAVSGIGSGVQAVALGYLGFELTHSAAALGLLAFLALAPGALLSQVGSILAVRIGPRRIGVIVYAVKPLPWAAVALVGISGHVTYLDLALAAAISGVLGALAGVDLPEIVPTTVPPGLRDRAIALEGASGQLSLLVGPLLGGVVLATFGAVPCFLLNAASYLPLVVALLMTPDPPPSALGQRRSTPMMSMMSMVPMVKLRGTLTRKDLQLLLVDVFVFSVFAQAIESLMPVVAHHYSASSGLLGELMAATAGGGLAATIGLTQLERRDLSSRPVIALAMLGAGSCILVIGIVPSLGATLVAVTGLGGCVAVLLAVSLSWIQLGPFQTQVKTRLIGIYFSLLAGGLALGSLGLGSVINRVGMTWTLGVCGILVVSVAGGGLLARSSPRGVKPDPDPVP